MKDYAYLVCATAVANHNKFYEITLNEDGSLDTKHGRVGTNGVAVHYNAGERTFEGLLKEKERKGYKINNRGVKETIGTNGAPKYKPIEDREIAYLVDEMMEKSAQFMQQNYTVKKEEITEKMVNEAKAKLAELHALADGGNATIHIFNHILEDLFAAVPRRMEQVAKYEANSPADFNRILDREDDLFDSMYQIYLQTKAQKEAAAKMVQSAENGNKTALEAGGIQMDECTYAEEDYIIKKLAKKNWEKLSNENRFIRAFKVTNEKTEKQFNDYCDTKASLKNSAAHQGTRMYFHGTGFQNLWSIINNGLILNPNARICGKAFGQGIYFAEHSQKSLGYTSIQGSRWASGNQSTGFLLMYEVAAGNSLKINDGSDQSRYGVYSSFNEKSLKRAGDFDSVYAVGRSENGGRGVFQNSEIMVYNEKACTIRYIIEIASRNRDFNLDYDDRKKIEFAPSDIKVSVDKNARLTFKVKNDDTDLTVAYNPEIDSADITGTVIGRQCSRLTDADCKWVMRAIKKVYADSEKQWKELMTSDNRDKFLGIDTKSRGKQITD